MTLDNNAAAAGAQTVNRPVTGFSSRWIAAIAVTLLCALPISWLLATAALLPFYLGLFFFALFGLLLGAVQFRIASPAAPIARPTVYLGGIVVIVVTWLLAMDIEYRHLASDATRFVRESQRTLTLEQLKQINADTPARIRDNLKQNYPPGGMIGYMRWAARSGRITAGTEQHGRPIVFRLRQGPIGWSIRVVLSAALLTFGVMSQVLTLAKPPAPRDEKSEIKAVPAQKA